MDNSKKKIYRQARQQLYTSKKEEKEITLDNLKLGHYQKKFQIIFIRPNVIDPYFPNKFF